MTCSILLLLQEATARNSAADSGGSRGIGWADKLEFGHWAGATDSGGGGGGLAAGRSDGGDKLDVSVSFAALMPRTRLNEWHAPGAWHYRSSQPAMMDRAPCRLPFPVAKRNVITGGHAVGAAPHGAGAARPGANVISL